MSMADEHCQCIQAVVTRDYLSFKRDVLVGNVASEIFSDLHFHQLLAF